MTAPALALTVVAALRAAGVSWVVLSPGSRNGGLALALAAAEKRGELRLHVVLDERGAGFVAVGLAKVTQQPVAVVVTSGTAAANLAPAVAEAHHSTLPLVVVTADRPVAVHDSGASQTTRQVGLFGGLTRQVTRLTSQSGEPADWAWQVRRAVGLASGERTRQPGPVHLNVELAEPLFDQILLDPAPAGRWAAAEQVTAPTSEPWRVPAGPRTVILAGDASLAQGELAVRLAERGRVPLLAEPSSNARRGGQAIAGYRQLLTTELADRIERVILIGHPTLSRPVTALLRRDDLEVLVVSELADPPVPGMRGHRIATDLDLEPGSEDWLQSWTEADSARPTNAVTVPLNAAQVAAAVWKHTAGQPLMVGSSASIRQLDDLPIGAQPPRVWANRGLAGIDGTLHTAAGIALALQEPVTVLLGDLTFLHDLTGLVVGELEKRQPLRVVVVDDHGGAIFHGLEQGQPGYAEHFERVFGTPQAVDLAAAAAGLGAEVIAVETVAGLEQALASRPAGLQVVVAQVRRG